MELLAGLDPELISKVRQHLWNALEDWRNTWWVTAYGCTQEDDPEVRKWFQALRSEEPLSGETALKAVAALHQYRQWIGARSAAEVETALNIPST